jgi:hypothetical protein
MHKVLMKNFLRFRFVFGAGIFKERKPFANSCLALIKHYKASHQMAASTAYIAYSTLTLIIPPQHQNFLSRTMKKIENSVFTIERFMNPQKIYIAGDKFIQI